MAVRQGSDTRQINPAVGNQNQSHIDRRNLIADQADAMRAEEFGGDDDAPPVETPEPDEETGEDAPEPGGGGPESDPPEDEEGAGDDAPTPDEPPSQAPKIKIKVNGRDVELTQEELIQRAQKVESADEYLRSASEAFRRTLSPAPTPQGPPAAPEPQDEAITEEERAVARALQMGDEDAAALAIRRLRQAPPLSRDELRQEVDARIATRTAFSRFQDEFRDIVSDPRLFQLACARDAELLNQGDQRDPWERMKSVGEEIQSWRGTLTTPQARADKNARKASMHQVPSAAQRHAPAQHADAEEDVSTTIQKMAQARQGRPVQRGK